MIALLTGLVAGVFIGLYTVPSAAISREPARIDGSSLQNEPNPTSASNTKGTAGPTRAKAAIDATPDESTIRNLIDTSISQQATIAGDGIISGSIKDIAGKPVARIVVRMTPHYVKKSRPFTARVEIPKLKTIEDAVRETVEDYQHTTGATVEFETGADGNYSFSALNDHTYSVAAYSNKYKLEHFGKPEADARSGETVDFVARPIAAVRVELVLPDGGTPAEAIVFTTTHSNGAAYGYGYNWSAQDPYVYLSEGRFELRPSVKGSNAKLGESAFFAEPQTIEIDSGAAAPSVIFKLKAALQISGNIKFPAADERAIASVYMMEWPPDKPPMLEILRKAGRSKNVLGGAPNFNYQGLAAGSFLVGVARAGETAIVDHKIVTIGTESVEIVLEIPSLQKDDCLIANAVGKSGEKLDDLEFQFIIKSERIKLSNWARADQKHTGEYWITPPDDVETLFRKAWEPGTRVYLRATSRACGERTVELTSGQRTIDIIYDTPSRLTITISGYKGSGYEGKLSFLLDRASERALGYSRSPMIPIGADGTGSAANNQPGEYSIVLFSRIDAGDRTGTVPAERRTIQLTAGDNSLALPMPELYSLTVHVAGRTGDAFAAIRRISTDQFNDSSYPEFKIPEDGTITIPSMAPGEYEIRVIASEGNSSMNITVPAAGTIEFKAK